MPALLGMINKKIILDRKFYGYVNTFMSFLIYTNRELKQGIVILPKNIMQQFFIPVYLNVYGNKMLR